MLYFMIFFLFYFLYFFIYSLAELPGTPGAESCDSYNIFEPTPLDCISIKSSASSYLHDRDIYGKFCVKSVPSLTTLGNAPKAVDP